jgi:hypothetical protein
LSGFLKKLAIFIVTPFLAFILGVLLPTTPRASTSHMFAMLKMDSLLVHVPSRRLILLGGSNLSLSINSQILKDSLKINPINTGLSWTIGFVYNFDHTMKYLKQGDILVASIEYIQYYDGNAFGGQDLMRLILDVTPKEITNLRRQQLFNILPDIPYYAFSKYKPSEYLFHRNPLEIYDRNATNGYGDNCKHWNREAMKINSNKPLPKVLDNQAFDLLEEFRKEVEAKGARLLITFPALHSATYVRQEPGIKAIQRELQRRGLPLLGNPERYVMHDSVIFDTPYHFIKKGVDYRTQLLVEDLRYALH